MPTPTLVPCSFCAVCVFVCFCCSLALVGNVPEFREGRGKLAALEDRLQRRVEGRLGEALQVCVFVTHGWSGGESDGFTFAVFAICLQVCPFVQVCVSAVMGFGRKSGFCVCCLCICLQVCWFVLVLWFLVFDEHTVFVASSACLPSPACLPACPRPPGAFPQANNGSEVASLASLLLAVGRYSSLEAAYISSRLPLIAAMWDEAASMLASGSSAASAGAAAAAGGASAGGLAGGWLLLLYNNLMELLEGDAAWLGGCLGQQRQQLLVALLGAAFDKVGVTGREGQRGLSSGCGRCFEGLGSGFQTPARSTPDLKALPHSG